MTVSAITPFTGVATFGQLKTLRVQDSNTIGPAQESTVLMPHPTNYQDVQDAILPKRLSPPPSEGAGKRINTYG